MCQVWIQLCRRRYPKRSIRLSMRNRSRRPSFRLSRYVYFAMSRKQQADVRSCGRPQHLLCPCGYSFGQRYSPQQHRFLFHRMLQPSRILLSVDQGHVPISGQRFDYRRVSADLCQQERHLGCHYRRAKLYVWNQLRNWVWLLRRPRIMQAALWRRQHPDVWMDIILLGLQCHCFIFRTPNHSASCRMARLLQ